MRVLKVYSDGGARGNPGPAAAAFLVVDEKGKILVEKGCPLGKTTNNIAEYKALLAAIGWIHENIFLEEIDKIVFHLDSELVVKQLKGEYKIKNKGLLPLFERVRALQFKLRVPTEYLHIRRDRNTRADFLVNKVLDSPSHV